MKKNVYDPIAPESIEVELIEARKFWKKLLRQWKNVKFDENETKALEILKTALEGKYFHHEWYVVDGTDMNNLIVCEFDNAFASADKITDDDTRNFIYFRYANQQELCSHNNYSTENYFSSINYKEEFRIAKEFEKVYNSLFPNKMAIKDVYNNLYSIGIFHINSILRKLAMDILKNQAFVGNIEDLYTI